MIAAKVETSQIAASFREIARARGRPLAKVMQASGRRIAVRLTRMTQPFGFESSAKERGESAVKRDVALAFNTPSQVYREVEQKSAFAAKGFWKAVQDMNLQAVERILKSVGIERRIMEYPDRGYHKAARDSRGRVAKSMQDRAMVMVAERVAEYASEVAKRVGISAAGWAECAKQLGGYRGLVSGQSIPRWKRASGRKHAGRASVASVDRDPIVTMENNVPWLTKICPESTMSKALKQEEQTITKELDRALAHELKRSRLARF